MKKKKKTSKKWWWVFGGGLAVCLAVTIVIVVVLSRGPKFEDRGLPMINIELNWVSLEEINSGSKETKYEGNNLTIYDSGMTKSYGGVTVKGRGNGTWIQEKKPYQIKFNEKVNLFGMGKAKKWCLLANALDNTKVRTEAAFYLARMLKMKYTFNGEFVELYVDGEYRGLYYLTHAVEVGKYSVDLKNSLGILVELDNIYGSAEEYYETGNGDKLVVKGVVEKSKGREAVESFLQDYNEFEIAVRNKDYEKICELVDIESFAQYYLLSEFSVNPDAYWTSFYMYKDGLDDKIHAGPGWDFDLALANKNWGNWMGEEFYSPTNTMIRKGELRPKEFYEERGMDDAYSMSLSLSRVMFNLMEFPEFQDQVKVIFRERMSGRKNELIANISAAVKKIKVAVEHDGQKWGIVDYDDETKSLIEWIERRYEYFEQEYGQGESNPAHFL